MLVPFGRKPKRLVNFSGGFAQFFQTAGQFGPPVRRVHAAYRHKAKAAASPHDKANPVAFEQPASFIDDRIRCAPQVESGVDLPGKLVETKPVARRLFEPPQLAIAVELSDELGYDFEELKIAALGSRSAARPLEQLDQACRRLIDMPREQYQQSVRWICRSGHAGIGRWLATRRN